MPEFTNLSREPVREYWADEARKFTPWLADQIESEDPSEVEDVIQLDLSLRGTEQSVGRYNLDILAEAEDGRTVVIENQLEPSDHDHLGKCLAYASGVDADIVVWISPRFNDEHSDAFQWLNDHTQEGIDLFALRLEVWRIGDSDPAVRFTAVEEPSEWKAQAQRSTELTDTKKRYLEFWTGFRDVIQESDTPLSARKPFPENWYNNPIGRSGMKLQFKVSVQNGMAAAQFVIDDNPDAFEALQDEAAAIDAQIQGDVEWHSVEDSPDRSNRSRVTVTRDIDLEDEEKWPEYYDWLLHRGTELHDVFSDRVRDLAV
ncbi:hypothetical protein HALDL1_16550 [Halobacterium sp. DL1]|jgi:hypothetical protein|nr:hypothetical protein HALDL1_16550 [Halobacterium sp. DL1]